MDRIEHGIGDIGPARLLHALDRPQQRGEIAGLHRHQHRDGLGPQGEIDRVLVEAQQEIGAGLGAAPEFGWRGAVDADPETMLLEQPDAVFQMREGRIGKRSEIDDVGTLGRHGAGAFEQLPGRKLGCFDDLGKDGDVVARKIGRMAAPAEKGGQVGDLVGATVHGKVEMGREGRKIGPAPAGQQDAGDAFGQGDAAADDFFRHQGGDLDPGIEDRPVEGNRAQCRHRALEPDTAEMAGDQGEVVTHLSLSSTAWRRPS